MKSPLVELQELLAKSEQRLTDTLRSTIRAKARGDRGDVGRESLRRLLAQTLTLSHLMGRRRAMLELQAHLRGKFAASVSPLVPAVEFEQAVDDILTRHPKLAYGYRAVQELYAESHAFALAKSVDEILTRRVQKVIQDSIFNGEAAPRAQSIVAQLGDWTAAYAETVYRTNVATAYTAGRIAQSQDEDVREVMPAFEFIGRREPPSRRNHAAAVGLIAATDDALWGRYAPPLGYNCTHGIRLVDKYTLRRRGLLNADGSVTTYTPPGFDAAYPDPGFGRGSLATRLAI